MFDQLPWETRPQVLENTFAEITWKKGVLKLPRLGYLEVDEMNEIAKVDPNNGPYMLTMSKANELAVATELSPRYCYSLLARFYTRDIGAKVELTEDEENIAIRHSALVGDYLGQIHTMQNRVRIRAATVILNRIVPGWAEEKTRRLPKELTAQIYEFYLEEERGMDKPTTPEEDMKELDEQLGKLREVSLIATGQTGSGAIGSASGSGPAPPSSVASDSDASLVTTSSRPSKRATKPKGAASTRKSSESRNSHGFKPKPTETETSSASLSS